MTSSSSSWLPQLRGLAAVLTASPLTEAFTSAAGAFCHEPHWTAEVQQRVGGRNGMLLVMCH